MSKTSSDSENNSIPDNNLEYNYYPGKYKYIETGIMGAFNEGSMGPFLDIQLLFYITHC